MKQERITDDLDALMEVIPADISQAVAELGNSDNLLEVIMDLGRLPIARFVDQEVVVRQKEIVHQDLEYTVKRIGEVDTDNRAGIERTLHRISAIRNRKGDIVGFTCRVGRAVYGTTDIIKNLIESGKSLLLVGRPGVGKTTMLRESARILAETKRVVIVDTSNEIGGDGDVSHPAIGTARRMQVPRPSLQHEVMIEAVENHNPEVIIIDEIGRELEALAARTIAERGVQLIGTAHGNTLENLLLNPTLSDLVGGIESVTLSDEEARRRGTRKTVLERRSPPTFDVLIEIKDRNTLAVHYEVSASVDSLLRGYPIQPEIRHRTQEGKIEIKDQPKKKDSNSKRYQDWERITRGKEPIPQTGANHWGREMNEEYSQGILKTKRVFPYGVARNRLIQAGKQLGVPVVIEDDLGRADTLVTLRTYYRKRQKAIVDAENRGTPIYVLRSNTINQMQRFLTDLFRLSSRSNEELDADNVLKQTREAINAILNGERSVELKPARSAIRRVQHQMAQEARLTSISSGKEPKRRVRIHRG